MLTTATIKRVLLGDRGTQPTDDGHDDVDRVANAMLAMGTSLTWADTVDLTRLIP